MNPRMPRTLLGGLGILLPIALLLPFPIAAVEGGATFQVDQTGDAVDVDPGDGQCLSTLGGCTLRAAVMEANALPTADRIELGASFYSLSIPGSDEEAAASGDLDIYDNLTLVGRGMMATAIDAGGAAMGDRALHIHPGAVFTMEGVTVGYADIGAGANGAGLRNDDGTVVVRYSSFQWNRAHNGAGLMNVGNMSIEHSLIGYNIGTDAGAGVRNDGTLEIEGSAVIENEVAAGPGAGIENHGTLTIRNSTISNNRAGAGGAAIYNGTGPNGGSAYLTLNNATVFVNMILPGGSGGDVTGGIYNLPGSSVQLSNSIVAMNAVDYAPAADCLGAITSRGYNLFGSLEGCTVGGDPTTDRVTADPGLGAPYEMDPAFTVSYPLLPESPALDGGNPSAPGSSPFACAPADQRDIARPQGAACDIGAREMEAGPGTPPVPSPLPTDTPTDTATVTPTDTPTASATPAPSGLFFDGFETGDLSAWSSAQTDSGDLSVSPAAAIGGAFGLRAILDDNRSVFVVDTTPAGERTYSARFYFDPNGIAMASGNTHVIFKAMDAASRTAFQVELHSFQGDYQVRAYAPWDSGGAYATPWIRIRDDLHLIDLIWQAAAAEGVSDGWLALYVDGEGVAFGGGIDNDTRRVDSVRLGAVGGIDTATRGTYYFDAFGSAAGGYIGPDPAITLPPPTPAPDVIFADGFESGDLSAWSARKNETDLGVETSAALVGGYGLLAVVDDTASRYLTDWSPVADREYHARFAFAPNGLAMLDGRSHVLFQALAGASKVVARVELRYKSLHYEVRSGVLTDAGRWVNTQWFTVEDAPQVIELEWRAASDPDSSDGRLQLWINQDQSESLDGIANYASQVDLARLGLVAGVDAGTLGSVHFDAFASRRYSHIGLPEDEPTPMPSGTPTVTPTP